MLTVTATSRITLAVSSGIARIGLAHASLNVIDIQMMEELAGVLGEIDRRDDVSVILLSGEGKGFSSGVDVAAHSPERISEMLTKFHALIRTLIATRQITMAVIHGHCLGGGAELAMVCDIVYTADSAQWAFPEIKLGCYPPVACSALGSLIGQKRAAELILTGRTISGTEAANSRLATFAFPESELKEAVEQCVARLCQLSPAALAVAKKAIYAWDSMHFDKGLARAEKIYFEELMKTSDAQEGIRAFMEKREPQWTGK